MVGSITPVCSHCGHACVRKGRTGAVQLLRCRCCGRYQRCHYRHKARSPGMDAWIKALVREGCGIRGIARILAISATTVIARIRRMAAALVPPPIAMGRDYEVDELATFVGRRENRVWVAYAWERSRKRVVALRVGRRSKRLLRPLIEALVLADARRISTDGLDLYRSLVPRHLHRVKRFGTNGIERMNLELRTRLKRLARRTICFSKSASMLAACVGLVCFG